MPAFRETTTSAQVRPCEDRSRPGASEFLAMSAWLRQGGLPFRAASGCWISEQQRVAPATPHFKRLLDHKQVINAYLLAVAGTSRTVLLTLDRGFAPPGALRGRIDVISVGPS